MANFQFSLPFLTFVRIVSLNWNVLPSKYKLMRIIKTTRRNEYNKRKGYALYHSMMLCHRNKIRLRNCVVENQTQYLLLLHSMPYIYIF